jgi:ribosomal protein S8E
MTTQERKKRKMMVKRDPSTTKHLTVMPEQATRHEKWLDGKNMTQKEATLGVASESSDTVCQKQPLSCKTRPTCPQKKRSYHEKA